MKYRTITLAMMLALSGHTYAGNTDNGDVQNGAIKGDNIVNSYNGDTNNNITNEGGAGYGGSGAAWINIGDVTTRGGTGGQGGLGGNGYGGNGGRGGDGGNSNQSQSQNQALTGGNIDSSISATGSGNNTEVNVDASSKEDYSDMYEDYTPSAIAPSMPTTAPCYVGISGGGGVPGLSLSAGGAIYDKECEHRETIRLAYASTDKTVHKLADKAMTMKLEAIVAQEAKDKEERIKEEEAAKNKRSAFNFGDDTNS